MSATRGHMLAVSPVDEALLVEVARPDGPRHDGALRC